MSSPSVFRTLLGDTVRPMPSHTPGPPPRPLPAERYRPDTTMVGVDEPRWEQIRQQLVDRIALSPHIPEAFKPAVATSVQRLVELPRSVIEVFGQPESVAAPGVASGQLARQAADLAAPRLAQLAVDETGAVRIPSRGLGRLVDVVDPRSIRSRVEPVRLRDIVKDRFAGFEQLAQDLPFKADWRMAQSPTMRRAFGYDQPQANRWGYYVAATSPSNMVPGNTKESIASQWFRLRYPERRFTEAVLRDPRLPTTYGNPGSKWQNLNRADLGEPLSGEKVNAFGVFNTGGRDAAIDRHLLYAMGVRPNSPTGTEILLAPELPEIKARFEARLGHKISKQDAYNMLAGAVSDAVQEIRPRGVFADLYGDVWEGARAHKGEPFVGGPPDIIRAVGLGGHGAMKDVPLLEEVLREGARTPGFWTAKPR